MTGDTTVDPREVEYIKETLRQHFARSGTARRPLKGLRLLDVGCESRPQARSIT